MYQFLNRYLNSYRIFWVARHVKNISKYPSRNYLKNQVHLSRTFAMQLWECDIKSIFEKNFAKIRNKLEGTLIIIIKKRS